ncbi:FecR family protein [Pedobacter africanus]|uniref:FecR family protein n=1 Tax=Pedobacter africanus TaxID=151894 RepID=A0A1W1ZB21_9SPHI|nr:FecR family protein [Pedobacter africanus]SMC45526.1 FecR family protein [Pedobacter africanus]
MDQTTFYKQLLERYVNNTATAEELEVIDHLIGEAKLDELLMDHMAESWAKEEAVFEEGNEVVPGKTRRFKLWPRIATIAAALTAIVVGTWLYTSRHSATQPDYIKYANNIKPGKNQATITFANGKVVKLSDQKSGVVIGEELKYNDHTPVEATAGGSADDSAEEATITTPRGGTYQVTLADGTKVWLNAASSLTYSPVLNKEGIRRVKLEGEAYFEVAKDKDRPFIVDSKGQEVKVLGTHFNISSYADESAVKTTLLEGSVLVRSNLHKDEIVLKPSEQASLTGSAGIAVRQVDVNEAVAWKTGDFRFKDQLITDIMKQIARWYDVEVAYEGDLSAVRLDAFISRNRNISQLLMKMEQTNEVHFRIEGRRIIVKK